MSELLTSPAQALGGARFDGLVCVEEAPLQGMITLRGDFASPGFANVVSSAAATDMPGQREVRGTQDKALMWMSPDELALLCPYAEAAPMAAKLADMLAGSHALVANVSDARAHFLLKGPGLRDVIAKLAPVDMAPGAMPPGTLRRTRFAQVAAGIWMQDDATAQIFCFRSVAQYMFDLLSTAAAPESAVGHF